MKFFSHAISEVDCKRKPDPSDLV